MNCNTVVLFITVVLLAILVQWKSVCGSHAESGPRCKEQELSALMQIKAAFRTAENVYIREFDWEGSECCSWERVTCDLNTGHVTELDLSYGTTDQGCARDFGPPRTDRLLNGTVFLAFSQLRSLSLAARRMAGFVPGSGFESWSSLRELKTLDLSDNDFSISTISSLPAVKSLRTVYLDYNNLEGNLPITELIPRNSAVVSLRGCGLSGTLPYLGGWSSLEALSLEENDLNGTLTGLCQLKNLKELNLSRNSFTGDLPLCIGNLSSLKILDLSDNQLQIKFPSSVFERLVSLRYLSLSNNHLEGTLSLRSFINYTDIEVLGLSTTALNFRIEVVNLPSQLLDLELANCIVDAEPTFLYNQHKLQVLDLSNTQSKGLNPVLWLLQNNTNLTELDLHKNFFTGPLQLPFSAHEKLSMLDLSNNSLGGEMPIDIITYKLPTLSSLNLSINFFHGPLPLISTNNLLYLDLSVNNITDDVHNLFPVSAQFLPGIVLDLSHNSLYGSFPKNLDIHASMLLLNDNNISGEIPVSICSCSFSVLDISNNDLVGTLPGCIGSASVEYGALKLSGNLLEGPLPLEICYLEWWLLDLSDNKLSGSIPPCYGKSSLQVVNLSQNNLTGNFPVTWLNISSITAIDIQDNKLSGELSIRIGKDSELAMLQARKNLFVGHVPEQICQFKHLHILDLSHNNLSGQIPSCIIHMGMDPSQDIEVSDHGYQSEIRTAPLCADKIIHVTKNFGLKLMSKGRLDLYWNNILLAERLIDLSSNNLFGNIPEEIGQMSWLITLNLSNNHLTGAIPNSISNLSQLLSLDLSYNSLTGEIPRNMIKLTSLEYFSVAYNNLSGPTLGTQGQFITFGYSSYEGNPNLCGPQLTKNCTPAQNTLPPSPNEISKDKRREDADFLVLFGSFSLFFVASFWFFMVVLYFKKKWRYALFTLVDLYSDMIYVKVVLSMRKIRAARTRRGN